MQIYLLVMALYFMSKLFQVMDHGMVRQILPLLFLMGGVQIELEMVLM